VTQHPGSPLLRLQASSVEQSASASADCDAPPSARDYYSHRFPIRIIELFVKHLPLRVIFFGLFSNQMYKMLTELILELVSVIVSLLIVIGLVCLGEYCVGDLRHHNRTA
jgi:hypothetical protein